MVTNIVRSLSKSGLIKYFNENRELITTINDITKTFISKSE